MTIGQVPARKAVALFNCFEKWKKRRSDMIMRQLRHIAKDDKVVRVLDLTAVIKRFDY